MGKASLKDQELNILNFETTKKSCIRETPTHSTDADSSTDTIEILTWWLDDGLDDWLDD